MNMRRIFADILYEKMRKNDTIYVLTADLGYKMWDNIRDSYKGRFQNVGSSEQLLLGASVGLAISKKIPIAYSITPFLLYRPFEIIRNYLNHERIPVKLVGSGRGRDYHQDGFSHWSLDESKVFNFLSNIQTFYPETIEDLEDLIDEFLFNKKPSYLNLRK